MFSTSPGAAAFRIQSENETQYQDVDPDYQPNGTYHGDGIVHQPGNVHGISPNSCAPVSVEIERDFWPEYSEPGRITRPGSGLLLLAVMFSVGLCCFLRMMPSMHMMGPRNVRVMCRLFVLTGLMMLGSFLVMPRRVLVMFGGLPVMFSSLLGHAILL